MAMTVHVGNTHAERFINNGFIVNPDELNERIDTRYVENPPAILMPEHLLPDELDGRYLKKVDYGSVLAPVPTGADDATMLNAFLAANAGKNVMLRKTAYQLNSTLTLPTNTSLDGNGATLDYTGMLDGTALGQRIGITATGTLAASLPVANAVTQWNRVITGITSTATLAAGDLILLSNDEQPIPGMTRADRDKGELNVIQSVDSGTQITLTTGALFAYGASGIIIRKLTPVQNIKIRDLKMVMGGIASAHNAIQVRYGKNIAINDVIVDGAEDIAVSLNTVFNGKVNNCTLNNSTSSTTLGNTGYGVAIVEGSRFCQVENNTFDNCRHFVAGGGYWPPAFIDVTGNDGQRSSDAAYDCHESTFYWTFDRNTATGVASGFIIRGQYITITNNEIIDSLGRAYRVATFDGVTEQKGIRVNNNHASQSVYGIEIDGQELGAEPNCLKSDIEIINNTLRNCGPNPILLRHFNGAKVADNEIIGSTGNAIICYGVATDNRSKNLQLSNNVIRNAGDNGMRLQYLDDISINGGRTTNPVGYGIDILTSNRVSIASHNIRTPAKGGINVNAVTALSITNPHITGGTHASYDSIRVVGSTDLTINGGYLGSARWAINTTTTNYVVITGVNAMGAFTAGRISCDAANKIVADNLVA